MVVYIFCIDFHCLNACTKKDSYPLPRTQEVLENLVGTGHFSCLDLKSGLWQIRMDEALKQYTAFTVSNLGFSSATGCLLSVVMPQLLSNGLCRILWVN